MIPFADLKTQYITIKNEIDEAVQRVLDDGRFILGPDVELLEKEVASYFGVKYGIGVASGTDALVMALLACGISEGDEVITTPFTFIATAEAICRVGAKPVFCDIDINTYNIDSDKIEKKITSKTKAILLVHLFGLPCDMDKIVLIANKYNLKIIEDCAQSFGAEYKGRKVGSFGEAGCLSFFPSKNLGAYGDGGMVITNDEKIANNVRMLRNHGSTDKYYYRMHGFNSRLDTIQAAILRVKLKYVDKWIKMRQEVAENYISLLKDTDVILPYVPAGFKHSFNYFTIRIRNRDIIQKKLKEKNISTSVYYPLSLHLQEIYKNLGYKKGDFPISEKVQDEVLSLPIYPELTRENVKTVTNAIKELL